LIIEGFRIYIITQLLENIDKEFLEKSRKDIDITQQSVTSAVASIHTREIQNIDSINNMLFTRVDIPDAYKLDLSPFVERTFLVDTVEFSTSTARYQNITSSIKQLPGDVFRSNPSLLAATKIASYYRADLMLNISMAGTIAHSGCVLAGVIPPAPLPLNGDPHQHLINTILSGPHAFLFANEATSVTLGVPWYCNTDLATLDMEVSDTYKPSIDIVPVNGNYATLVLLVLNPLTASSGASTAVSIVIEACFKALDVSVPTPRYVSWIAQGLLGDVVSGISGLGTRLLDQTATGLKEVSSDAIDGARQMIKGWTGLHNPNDPRISQRIITTERNFGNTVDSAQFFEKLDPHTTYDRVVKQPLFGTDIDEMRISHIVAKKQLIGTISINTGDPVGKNIWSRPISPYQGSLDTTKPIIANNIELLHRISRAWRGGLRLHIQSVMNNKQQIKLRVLKMYNPSIKIIDSYPNYSSIVNAPSDMLEFTQGGQEHVIDLPYICRNDICPCSRDMSFEGLFHGMYYIYIAQFLTIADGSPTTAEFNIYLSGKEDLTFYGYATETQALYGFPDFRPSQSEIERFALALTNDTTQDHNIVVPKLRTDPGLRYNRSRNRWTDPRNKKRSTKVRFGTIKEEEQETEHPELVEESNTFEAQSFSHSIDLTHVINDWKFSDTRSNKSKFNKHKKGIKQDIKKPKRFQISCLWECVAQSLEVMNAPQHQDSSDMEKDRVVDFNHLDRLKPNYDLRSYIRRMYKVLGTSRKVDPSASETIVVPLATIAGEDNVVNYITASPLTAISSMFYGKTLGFKFKLKTTVLGDVATPNYIAQIYYLPPNMYWDISSHTTLGSKPSTLPIDPDPFQSTPAVFPLPLQVTPVQSNEVDGSFLYEFSIPDVTYFKFMGSPNKLVDAFTPTTPLATQNFGHIIINLINSSVSPVKIGVQLYSGYTDESRLGFHSIAPLILPLVWKPEPTDPDYMQTLYQGNPESNTKPPPAAVYPSMYRGGFL